MQIYVIKSQKLLLRSHKNVNLGGKNPQTSEKRHKTVNLCHKKSQTSVKITTL